VFVTDSNFYPSGAKLKPTQVEPHSELYTKVKLLALHATMAKGTSNDRQNGANTLSIMTFSIMTLCIMTLSIMTLSIMTLSIMTFSIMTFSIMTLSIMTLNIMALSINDTQHKWHSA
jgi:hypothetical protein